MIYRDIEGRVLESDGQPKLTPIDIRLAYDGDLDPLAVQMIFRGIEGSIPWIFALDLLQEGVASQQLVGFGDVKIRSSSSGQAVLVCLKSHEGHAHVGMPASEVLAFLGDVGEASSDCSTLLDAHIDNLIEEILNA